MNEVIDNMREWSKSRARAASLSTAEALESEATRQMNDFEVRLSPRVWSVAERTDPESGPAFNPLKRAFWKRNMGYVKTPGSAVCTRLAGRVDAREARV